MSFIIFRGRSSFSGLISQRTSTGTPRLKEIVSNSTYTPRDTPSEVDRMVDTRIADSLKIETNGSPAVLEELPTVRGLGRQILGTPEHIFRRNNKSCGGRCSVWSKGGQRGPCSSYVPRPTAMSVKGRYELHLPES